MAAPKLSNQQLLERIAQLVDDNGPAPRDERSYEERHGLTTPLKVGDLFTRRSFSDQSVNADQSVRENTLTTEQTRRMFRQSFIDADEDSEIPVYEPAGGRCPPDMVGVNYRDIRKNKELMLAVASLVGAQVFRIDKDDGSHVFCVNEPAFSRVKKHIKHQRDRRRLAVERAVRNLARERMQTMSTKVATDIRELAEQVKKTLRDNADVSC